MAYDPIVIARRGAFLQRIADYVRSGHPFWVTGEVSVAKAAELAAKFDRLYRVGETKSQRHRARKKGQGTAVLLMHGPYAVGDASHAARRSAVCWVLLLDDRPHAAREREQVRDAREKCDRIELFGYELVCLTKPRAEATVWTWRMPAARFEHWRTRMLQAARGSRAVGVSEALDHLYGTLGFFGARSQVGQLMALFRREWQRRRREPLPPTRKLPYLARVANGTTRVSRLGRAAFPANLGDS